jgi:phage terminase small subunit
MPKGETLSVKQKKYVREFVRTGNGTKAALEAYDTKDNKTASVISAENQNKPLIKQAIEDALLHLEITPQWILGKHKRLVEDGEKSLEAGHRMVATRNLEDLGKISNLYPSTKTDMELSDGKLKISWEN